MRRCAARDQEQGVDVAVRRRSSKLADDAGVKALRRGAHIAAVMTRLGVRWVSDAQEEGGKAQVERRSFAAELGAQQLDEVALHPAARAACSFFPSTTSSDGRREQSRSTRACTYCVVVQASRKHPACLPKQLQAAL